MMTNEFEEELILDEKISLGFEKVQKLRNVIDLVNNNSINNEKLDLYDTFKTLLSSESFLSGLNQVNLISCNF